MHGRHLDAVGPSRRLLRLRLNGIWLGPSVAKPVCRGKMACCHVGEQHWRCTCRRTARCSGAAPWPATPCWAARWLSPASACIPAPHPPPGVRSGLFQVNIGRCCFVRRQYACATTLSQHSRRASAVAGRRDGTRGTQMLLDRQDGTAPSRDIHGAVTRGQAFGCAPSLRRCTSAAGCLQRPSVLRLHSRRAPPVGPLRLQCGSCRHIAPRSCMRTSCEVSKI